VLKSFSPLFKEHKFAKYLSLIESSSSPIFWTFELIFELLRILWIVGVFVEFIVGFAWLARRLRELFSWFKLFGLINFDISEFILADVLNLNDGDIWEGWTLFDKVLKKEGEVSDEDTRLIFVMVSFKGKLLSSCGKSLKFSKRFGFNWGMGELNVFGVGIINDGIVFSKTGSRFWFEV